MDERDTVASTHLDAEELFRAHAQFVASFLFRLGVGASDVPDLVQEVFLVAHRRGGFVDDGRAKPSTWLGAIAVRVASGHRRKRAPQPEAEVEVSDERTPEREVAARRALDRVDACLSALDDSHRAVFVAFELEGIPATEIAIMLEVPVGTVYSRLHHARERVRARYAELSR